MEDVAQQVPLGPVSASRLHPRKAAYCDRPAPNERLVPSLTYDQHVRPKLTDMKTWTGRTGHAGLRSFTEKNGSFWLEQNAAKESKWAKLAQDGHEVAWEFSAGGSYTGRILIDGEIYTPPASARAWVAGCLVVVLLLDQIQAWRLYLYIELPIRRQWTGMTALQAHFGSFFEPSNSPTCS